MSTHHIKRLLLLLLVFAVLAIPCGTANVSSVLAEVQWHISNAPVVTATCDTWTVTVDTNWVDWNGVPHPGTIVQSSNLTGNWAPGQTSVNWSVTVQWSTGETDTKSGTIQRPADCPIEYEGNLTCKDLNLGTAELKVDPPTSGTKSDGTLAVNVTVFRTSTGEQAFDFAANQGVVAVLAKGGNGGNMYAYTPAQAFGYGLHAPANASGKWADLSHMNFCYNPAPRPTETASTVPATATATATDVPNTPTATFTPDVIIPELRTPTPEVSPTVTPVPNTPTPTVTATPGKDDATEPATLTPTATATGVISNVTPESTEETTDLDEAPEPGQWNVMDYLNVFGGLVFMPTVQH